MGYISSNLFFVTLLFLSFLSKAQEDIDWIAPNSFVDRRNFHDIDLIGPDTVHIVGEKGVYVQSSNGGTSWEVNEVGGEGMRLDGVNFPTPDTGFIIGNRPSEARNINTRGVILRTTDGGDHWEPYDHKPPFELNDVLMLNGKEGWILGNYGSVLRTEDGGETWKYQRLGYSRLRLNDIFFLDEESGWIVGKTATYEFPGNYHRKTDNVLFKTENGGDDWHPVPVDVPLVFQHVFFTDSSTGWLTGGD